jgi:hypothetical protein
MTLDVNGPTGTGTPRTFSLNLGDPVAGGGGQPLGVVTVRGDNLLYASWQRVGNLLRSLVSIPLGETVQADQLNVSFHLDGRFHVLQFGPRPLGSCHEGGGTRVHGGGTTAGTIHRASATRWVVDLPPGSVGRLFDASHTVRHAVDKGLYRISLHYEIANAVPGAGAVLRPLAETQGGAAVVARYRLMKRDSADAYFFSAQELWPAGFHLLDNKRPAEALLVFRLSADEYPESTHSFGGLGESFLALGDTAQAISSLRRAVALLPDNQRAREALRRLGVTP